MKNYNSSSGRSVAGMIGKVRSPLAGCLVATPKLHPSVGANTTVSGIGKASAPIRSPQNGGNIVRYSA